VYLLARGPERLQEVEAQLGPSTTGIPTDVGNPDSVTAAFDHIAARHQKLDILINTAAVYRPCPFDIVTRPRGQKLEVLRSRSY
jgi:meso-butanediol dehydrogenase/(S,S)-butanediol dehydrogenase/diacetyl reductase